MFDFKTDKWFIRVENEQQAVAAQEWAFEQGFGWSGRKTLREDFRSWDMPRAIGCGHGGAGYMGQAPAQYWFVHGHKEIKMSFKVVVDEVVLPVVESQQQKQIRELEETIARATQQIQELKKDI